MIPNMKKKKNIYIKMKKTKKNKENKKIQTTNKTLSSIDKNLFSSNHIFNLSLFAFDINKKV